MRNPSVEQIEFELRREVADLKERLAASERAPSARSGAVEPVTASRDQVLVEQSPFGVYAVDADFRLVLVSAGAQKVFETVRPLIGRDFAEVLRTIWPEPFASEAIGRFRRTLETGERYHAPRTVDQRHDIDIVESYDWTIERVTLSDGRPGVICHFYDLSERRRYEAALRDADRQKDEFLAMLAHELRNPLAAVQTAVSLLQARGPSEPLLVRSRDVIARQAAQMARLLEDLLDVSRLSRGELTLKRTLVPLEDVIDAAVETSRPSIDQRGQHLELLGVTAGLLLDADPTRMTQVFANLLNNASKYSAEGSRISIDVEPEGVEVVVRVRDRGIGIEPEMLEQIFDLFAQAPGARDHAPGGLGMGLSLARRLVDFHGGRITAASGGAGQGSEFAVWLPLASQRVDCARARTSQLHSGFPVR
jgi:signal transduction histidine kinase